ncbi:MAG: hypothetical protein ABIJ17_02625 [Patescibacteria group bacterium]
MIKILEKILKMDKKIWIEYENDNIFQNSFNFYDFSQNEKIWFKCQKKDIPNRIIKKIREYFFAKNINSKILKYEASNHFQNYRFIINGGKYE